MMLVSTSIFSGMGHQLVIFPRWSDQMGCQIHTLLHIFGCNGLRNMVLVSIHMFSGVGNRMVTFWQVSHKQGCHIRQPGLPNTYFLTYLRSSWTQKHASGVYTNVLGWTIQSTGLLDPCKHSPRWWFPRIIVIALFCFYFAQVAKHTKFRDPIPF